MDADPRDTLRDAAQERLDEWMQHVEDTTGSPPIVVASLTLTRDPANPGKAIATIIGRADGDVATAEDVAPFVARAAAQLASELGGQVNVVEAPNVGQG